MTCMREKPQTSITRATRIGRFLDYRGVYTVLTSARGWRIDFDAGIGAVLEDSMKRIRNFSGLALSSFIPSLLHSNSLAPSLFYLVRVTLCFRLHHLTVYSTDYCGSELVFEVATGMKMAFGISYGEPKRVSWGGRGFRTLGSGDRLTSCKSPCRTGFEGRDDHRKPPE